MEESDECIKEHAFRCIGGGALAPSCISRMLGWVMHRLFSLLALATAKLYFIVFVFLFSSILSSADKKMESNVVNFG